MKKVCLFYLIWKNEFAAGKNKFFLYGFNLAIIAILRQLRQILS